MWRALLKCFLPSKHEQARFPYHDPAVVPTAPILSGSRHERSSSCIHGHQWNPDNSCTRHERLPACGYWTPSSSYISSSSNQLPWTVASVPDNESALLEYPNDDSNSDHPVDFAAIYPLKRVLAIGRREGECIRRRRNIYKFISPEELVEGLGMMLVDRSTSISFEIHEAEKKAPVAVRRNGVWIIYEEYDDDDSDEEW